MIGEAPWIIVNIIVGMDIIDNIIVGMDIIDILLLKQSRYTANKSIHILVSIWS